MIKNIITRIRQNLSDWCESKRDNSENIKSEIFWDRLSWWFLMGEWKKESDNKQKGWLETLPDGYIERALKNLEKKHENDVKECLLDALHGAFPWCTSSEGHEFWGDVYFWAQTKHALPALPVERPLMEPSDLAGCWIQKRGSEDQQHLVIAMSHHTIWVYSQSYPMTYLSEHFQWSRDCKTWSSDWRKPI